MTSEKLNFLHLKGTHGNRREFVSETVSLYSLVSVNNNRGVFSALPRQRASHGDASMRLHEAL